MTYTATPEALKKLSRMMRLIEDSGATPLQASKNDFRGELLFLAHAPASTLSQTATQGHVGVTYAHADRRYYSALSGPAEILPPLPGEATAILKVNVDQMEYWDSSSSGMIHLFGKLKVVTTDSHCIRVKIG